MCIRDSACCTAWRANLIALRDLEPGDEVTTQRTGHVAGPTGNDHGLEVTFDGGARDVRGGRVAGAGAVLWGPPGESGERIRLATAWTALPAEQHAQLAEGEGCAAAARLVLAAGVAPISARITGDNLAVVRHAVGCARLHRPAMHQAMAGPLADLALAGWSPEWLAVRRRLNKAADAVATQAVFWAARIRDQGERGRRTEVHWHVNRGDIAALSLIHI